VVEKVEEVTEVLTIKVTCPEPDKSAGKHANAAKDLLMQQQTMMMTKTMKFLSLSTPQTVILCVLSLASSPWNLQMKMMKKDQTLSLAMKIGFQK
jgi:hypothetical protein